MSGYNVYWNAQSKKIIIIKKNTDCVDLKGHTGQLKYIFFK